MMVLMLLRGGDFFDLIERGIALLGLAGLLAVAAWGVTRILPSRRGERAGSAEEILRERFARGEISAEEYVKSYQACTRLRRRGATKTTCGTSWIG